MSQPHNTTNLPPINTVVPLPQLKEICEEYGLTDQLYILNIDPPTAKPFKSDGASFFPDEITTHNGTVNIYPAAFLHDIAYWCGYPNQPDTAKARLRADRRLRRDVVHLCGGSEELAWLMYQGVRIGGSPNTPLPWRWGFGR